jgi:putative hemolysin
MLRLESRPSCRGRARLSVSLARSADEVRDAQKLRWRVFAGELGARLSSNETGVDKDRFDGHCEHLVVRDEASGEVVGTYRILTGPSAHELGGFYSAQEFDLSRLAHLGDRTVEIGRSCIHPDYRGGATMAMLWSGIAQFMTSRRFDHLIGCASVSMSDGGHGAASLYNRLRVASLSPVEYRVFPKCPLPLDRLDANRPAEPPALLRGYLRCGAQVCGEPAWDPDFNTADLFMMLPLARMDTRYARHFMKDVRPQ